MICIKLSLEINDHFTSQGQGIIIHRRPLNPKPSNVTVQQKSWLGRQRNWEGQGSPCDLIISQHAFWDRRVPRWGSGG